MQRKQGSRPHSRFRLVPLLLLSAVVLAAAAGLFSCAYHPLMARAGNDAVPAGSVKIFSVLGNPWQNGFVCIKRNRCIEQEPAGAPIFYVSLFNLTAT